MTCLLDFQGFKDGNNVFIVKELAIAHEDGTWDTFLFKPPQDVFMTKPYERSNRYCTREIHGLRWKEGDLDYETLGSILEERTSPVIFVKGQEKMIFLSNILPGKEIKNLEEILPTRISSLPKVDYECFHEGPSCAVRNVLKLSNWMQGVYKFFINKECLI